MARVNYCSGKSQIHGGNNLVPANLILLEEMLGNQGYLVRSFPRGRLALEAAARNPPDLILLDINMPEMSGFQMCEILKADEKLAAIPVIFLSALSEVGDKVHAFECGGVDYVTKPFQVDEVQARVETHLKIHQLQKELQLHANHLEEKVAARTHELAETQARLKVLDRAKTDFLRLIHHELRSPLNGLLGVGELVLDEDGWHGWAGRTAVSSEPSRRGSLRFWTMRCCSQRLKWLVKIFRSEPPI